MVTQDFSRSTAQITAVAALVKRDRNGYVLLPDAVGNGFARRLFSRLFRAAQPPLTRLCW